MGIVPPWLRPLWKLRKNLSWPCFSFEHVQFPKTTDRMCKICMMQLTPITNKLISSNIGELAMKLISKLLLISKWSNFSVSCYTLHSKSIIGKSLLIIKLFPNNLCRLLQWGCHSCNLDCKCYGYCMSDHMTCIFTMEQDINVYLGATKDNT